jgi:hypothetical protein
VWDECLPPNCPPHEEKPYAFKVHAILDAQRAGYDQVVWADTSVWFNRPKFDDMWDMLTREGYIICKNAEHNCAQWSTDAALRAFGMGRNEAESIPQIVATAFALDLRHEYIKEFCLNLREMADHDEIFPGAWVNDKHQCSRDPRVRGHRHDQTAMSVLCNAMHMHVLPYIVWPSFFQTCYGPVADRFYRESVR